MRMEIEIPDRIYEHAKEGSEDSRDESDAIYAIKNGIQLKTGKWEWVQYDANPEIGKFHCSECWYIPAIFNLSAQWMHYCPNCGTRMLKEVSE